MTARPTIKKSRKILFCSWFLVSCCLLLLPPQITAPAQSLFRRVFRAPLQFGYGLPALASANTVTTTLDPQVQARLQQLEHENNQLRNHIATIEVELADKMQRINELAGIRHELGLEKMRLVAADTIMALNPGHLVLNRGQRDGLYPGLFAIVNNAVVGQLVRTSRQEAELLLATHPRSSIAAFIHAKTGERERIIGKLDGTGEALMRMRIRSENKIPLNAHVYVCRQNTLDMALPIGRVESFQRDKEEPWLWEVQVEPATDLNDLQGVCLLQPAS